MSCGLEPEIKGTDRHDREDGDRDQPVVLDKLLAYQVRSGSR